jgi:hypothetical protein
MRDRKKRAPPGRSRLKAGNPKFYGLLKRKNRFPVGGVMVMLLVPLAVVMEYPLVVQLAVAAGLLFCSNV